ncbi:MAG: cation:proton antiporter [Deltaproteobacteria bacterium]|nr:cation:proton antiporter [Deltaproteobacteria bacterium]
MENLPFLLLAGLMLSSFFAVSYASQKLRLPSVLAYIVLGAGVSVVFLENEFIFVAAEIGIVLLFFILGLEFPLARMMTISKRIWPAGLLDIGLNLGGAMAVSLLFGLDIVSALTIGSVADALTILHRYPPKCWKKRNVWPTPRPSLFWHCCMI